MQKNNESEKCGHKNQTVFEQLWLNYYNNVLYEKGIITEDEKNRMALKIQSVKS